MNPYHSKRFQFARNMLETMQRPDGDTATEEDWDTFNMLIDIYSEIVWDLSHSVMLNGTDDQKEWMTKWAAECDRVWANDTWEDEEEEDESHPTPEPEQYNGSKDFPPNETDETCPICLEAYDKEIGRLKDGIQNSGYESNCPHWCCCMCWDQMYKQYNDTYSCPICKRDITDWLKTHYDSDDEDE